MTVKQLQEEILTLKKQNDVIILAHYYQPIEIQEIADYIGDSLGLSRTSNEKTNTDYIIFAGVDFMAETASILNQDKHVLIPNYESCCPMAAFLTPEMVIDFKQKHPGLPVVVYVNSTAAVKAESDICCTSSNAVKITENISKEFNVKSVLFGPDANLADYTEQMSKIKTIKMPKSGHCYVHSQITVGDIEIGRERYPEAKLLVHPECVREVRDLADFVGSTAHMYNRVKDSSQDEKEFIIGTEQGLVERIAQDFQDKTFHLAKDKLICYNMKKHNLELIKYLLENLDDKTFEVKVPSEIAKRAIEPIEKMLKYS
ncbi:MAG: quinolinate synthase NadA [Candidatus Lokiarchaeota archaeon]|nr:quinolinate synthase NadA [Candidatus Lokiarchaeota archaeon]